MKTVKLTGHEKAQAQVLVFDDGSKYLISYRTTVCMVNPAGWFTITGLYSTTTKKHIRYFLREFFPAFNSIFSFDIARKLISDNMMINMNTGEVVPVHA